jgi:hypothetical protein
MNEKMNGHNPLLNAALEYARLGYWVVPLHTLRHGVCSCKNGGECGTPGKHPHIKWGHLAKPLSASQIHDCWEQWPDANIGVLTGPAQNLLVAETERSGHKHSGSAAALAASPVEKASQRRLVCAGSSTGGLRRCSPVGDASLAHHQMQQMKGANFQ